MSALVTTQELVKASGLHWSTVVKAAQSGKLRGSKTSAKTGWRFPLAEARRWAEMYLQREARESVLRFISAQKSASDEKNRLHSEGVIPPSLGGKSRLRSQETLPLGDICSGPVGVTASAGPCVSTSNTKSNMNIGIKQIIPLSETHEGRPTVNARDLHAFLGVGKEFANWIKDRIRRWGFGESVDYVVVASSGKNPKGGRSEVEYHLSLEMAKELAMVERSDKGKQARLYFIECERALQEGRNAFQELDMDSILRAIVGNMWDPKVPAGILKRVLPAGQYGAIGKNGRPQTGFRRSSWVAGPSRLLEAAKLITQIQLLELFEEQSGDSLA